MFSFVTQNWQGKPLLNREVVVELIGATTTQCGLVVKAVLDTTAYPIDLKVSDEELARVNIIPDEFHGEWNYCIHPKQQTSRLFFDDLLLILRYDASATRSHA